MVCIFQRWHTTVRVNLKQLTRKSDKCILLRFMTVTAYFLFECQEVSQHWPSVLETWLLVQDVNTTPHSQPWAAHLFALSCIRWTALNWCFSCIVQHHESRAENVVPFSQHSISTVWSQTHHSIALWYTCVSTTHLCDICTQSVFCDNETAKQAFSVAAPNTWNSMPIDIRNTDCLSTFHHKLDTPYMTRHTQHSASVSSF